MPIGLFATLQCAPGKRNEVFTKIAKVSEIALDEPEPLTLLICFPTFLQPPPSQNPKPQQGSVTEEDTIYIFERFRSAETRKSGTPGSTPAFYNLLSEMLAAKPPLVMGMTKTEILEERYVRFRDGVEDKVPDGKGRIFVTVVKEAVEGDAEEDRGKDNPLEQGTEGIRELASSAGRSLFDAVWIAESITWRLHCWECESGWEACGGGETEGTSGNREAEGEKSYVAKKGFVRKRILDADDGTTKFLHDAEIL